jgi:hypothetical protein
MFRYRIAILKVPDDGNAVPKHIGVILTVNCVSRFVFYCILLRTFVGQYTEYSGVLNKYQISETAIVAQPTDGHQNIKFYTRHPCSLWDSNPQFQQVRCRTPTP